jgi:hypothetical protein
MRRAGLFAAWALALAAPAVARTGDSAREETAGYIALVRQNYHWWIEALNQRLAARGACPSARSTGPQATRR